MSRTEDKNIKNRVFNSISSIPSDFTPSDFEAAIRDQGYNVIFERRISCPCQTERADNLTNCLNCGGSGYLWINPISTKMVLSGKNLDKNYVDIGQQDLGKVMISAFSKDKLSFFDKITLLDGEAEHSETVYAKKNSENDRFIIFTHYDIDTVFYIARFVSPTEKLVRLIEDQDYIYSNNSIILSESFNSFSEPLSITIRYIHSPVYYVVDMARDVMNVKVEGANGRVSMKMPVLGIGQRSHLIKDIENISGDRLFDNSFEQNDMSCLEETNRVQQIIRNLSASTLYGHLTPQQIIDLAQQFENNGTDITSLSYSGNSQNIGVNTSITDMIPVIVPVISGGSFTYRVSEDDTLPTGLSLDIDTGIISGIPTITGLYTFTILVRGDGAAKGQASEDVILNVGTALLSLSYTNNNQGITLTDPIIDMVASILPTGISGGVVMYQIASTSILPTGLTLDSVTGLISGIPLVAMNYNFTVEAVGSGTLIGTVSQPLSLLVL
jgi:hypothetical protein